MTRRRFFNLFIFAIVAISGWFGYQYSKGAPETEVVDSIRTGNFGSSSGDKKYASFPPDLSFGSLMQSNPDAPSRRESIPDLFIWSGASVAIDAETGTILHYQEGKKKLAIASLTKMMTAVLVMEHIQDLDNEIVTIPKEVLSVEGTKIGCPRTGYCISNTVRSGEKLTARSLLEATLMNSANDAAITLGIHVAGSQKEFAKMMNDKAKEIGLMDTHFCNPSGLDEDDNPGGCYSTAYDLARISAYSLKYKTIWDIMRMENKDIYSVDGQLSHMIINTDVLLDQMPNCIGGKTGFTYEAGKSLMMAAHDPANKKHRVIGVILNDEQRWQDMKTLLDWTFMAYRWPENN